MACTGQWQEDLIRISGIRSIPSPNWIVFDHLMVSIKLSFSQWMSQRRICFLQSKELVVAGSRLERRSMAKKRTSAAAQILALGKVLMSRLTNKHISSRGVMGAFWLILSPRNLRMPFSTDVRTKLSNRGLGRSNSQYNRFTIFRYCLMEEYLCVWASITAYLQRVRVEAGTAVQPIAMQKAR